MRAALFLGAALLPAPLWADMSAEQCQQGWQQAAAIMAGDPMDGMSFGISPDGWCEALVPRFALNDYQDIGIAALRWRAEGIDRLIEQGLPPLSLEVEIDDLRFITKTGDPVSDYAMDLMMRPYTTDASLSVHWDADALAVLVDRADIILPGTNSISLTGRIDRVDLSDLAALQTSAGRAGIGALSLSIVSNGMFETYGAVPLAGALLDGDSDVPFGDQVIAHIALAKAFLSEVPEDILPEDSRAALAALLDEMPTPAGQLDLTVAADPPLGPARFLTLGWGDNRGVGAFFDALDGVALSAVWTPTEEEDE